MTVRFLKAMWLLGSLLAFTMVVNAQSEALNVRVPFAFVAGGKLLPAGNYRVDRGEVANVLLIHNASGDSSAFLTMTMESSAAAETASLVFAREGPALVLSAIRFRGQQSRILDAPQSATKGGVAAVAVSSR
jgi:hypothetical protein